VWIKGTTLMAFGNGAPDIFSSIASVISVNRPQAGLAISCLLGKTRLHFSMITSESHIHIYTTKYSGAGIFVTTVVIAGIILIKPFTCNILISEYRELYMSFKAWDGPWFATFSSTLLLCAFWLWRYSTTIKCICGSQLACSSVNMVFMTFNNNV
jgi:Ca2+/Na+ antiporter